MPARRKCGPSRWSSPTPSATFDDVGAGRLADVRDLVDERDARHQERVRRELDHLRRVDIARTIGASSDAYSAATRVRVVGVERADHDPVRPMKSRDRPALGEELGVGRVADVARPRFVEPARTFSPVPTGTVDFITRTDAPELRQLVDHRPDARQVGVSRVGGRRSTHTKRNSHPATSPPRACTSTDYDSTRGVRQPSSRNRTSPR